MPCPDLVVPGSLPHVSSLWYGDKVEVTCNREKGYLTPKGEDSFTVTCGHNGATTVLNSVVGCEREY